MMLLTHGVAHSRSTCDCNLSLEFSPAVLAINSNRLPESEICARLWRLANRSGDSGLLIITYMCRFSTKIYSIDSDGSATLSYVAPRGVFDLEYLKEDMQSLFALSFAESEICGGLNCGVYRIADSSLFDDSIPCYVKYERGSFDTYSDTDIRTLLLPNGDWRCDASYNCDAMDSGRDDSRQDEILPDIPWDMIGRVASYRIGCVLKDAADENEMSDDTDGVIGDVVEGKLAGDNEETSSIVADELSTPALSYPLYVDEGTAFLSWNAVEGATSYRIERSTNSDMSNFTVVYVGSDTSYIAHDLEAERRYYYRIKAVNSTVESLYSDSIIIFLNILRGSLAAMPQSNGEVLLEWDDIDRAVCYLVYRSVGSVSNMFVSYDLVFNNRYVDKRAFDGAKYSYAISAITTEGNVIACSDRVDVAAPNF